MPTVSRGLPERPHLDVPRREARELLDQWRDGQPEALERIRGRHPKYHDADRSTLTTARLRLSDAQLVVAREYGFTSWSALKHRIELSAVADKLERAIHQDDRATVVRILRAHPAMLDLPVWSGNWGPPMSHAANLGRLDIIKAVAALGARDFQHAFDRALLQGQIETARWLHAQGATLAPGIIMGSCETLNAAGFELLIDLGAPLVNERGDPLAPLALVLETYGRNPSGKHAILERFAQLGYELPDTPVMSLHRGDVARLDRQLQSDPRLLERRFTLRDIYPLECGCSKDGGMHWTPIDGTTLLHLAIDFREKEIFDWLLARGADVDARATRDAESFGGHTPLFNAVVNGPQQDATFARALLDRGASATARASLRKFLDWREEPAWHLARDVTPAEWARGFPDQGWVNTSASRLLPSTGR
jgi:Ankyrin repeat